MKKLKQTYLRSGRVIGAVLLLLMIVGSIWDLPISKFLYPGRMHARRHLLLWTPAAGAGAPVAVLRHGGGLVLRRSLDRLC